MPLPLDYAARKMWQLWTYLTEYFPDAFLAEVEVAVKGNQQHNPGEPLHWAREKSKDHYNTAMRHMWDHKFSGPLDTDGCYHLAKARWRLGAALQECIEAERAAGVSSGHDNQDQTKSQGPAAQERGCSSGKTHPRREADFGGQFT